MTDVEALEADLAGVVAELADVEARRSELYDRRRRLFAQLLEQGRSRAHCGRLAHVSAMAVTLAVGIPPAQNGGP